MKPKKKAAILTQYSRLLAEYIRQRQIKDLLLELVLYIQPGPDMYLAHTKIDEANTEIDRIRASVNALDDRLGWAPLDWC